VFTGFWLGGAKVRDHCEEDNFKMVLREIGIQIRSTSDYL
jgi:hypothetical protein